MLTLNPGKLRHWLLFGLLAMMPQHAAFADADTRWAVSDKGIDACRTIQNRVDRLSCFDALFETPNTLATIEARPADPLAGRPGPITQLIDEVDRARRGPLPPIHQELRPWQTELRMSAEAFQSFLERQAKTTEDPTYFKRTLMQPFDYAADTVDVFLVTRSLLPEVSAGQARPSSSTRALMMMSCENDITRLALRLPEPIESRRIQVELRTTSGGKLGVWQSLENGYIVSAGRGLESIGLIAGMRGHDRVQIELITDEQVYPFFFNVENLESVIGALRTACHW